MTYYLYDETGRYAGSVVLLENEPAPFRSTIQSPPGPNAIRRGREWRIVPPAPEAPADQGELF